MTAVLFSAAARLLADEARRRGLAVPSFRCPPRSDGVVRSIRRLPDGRVIVAVRVRGRPHADVVADMVEGVIVANGLGEEAAAQARAALIDTAAAAPSEKAEPGDRAAA